MKHRILSLFAKALFILFAIAFLLSAFLCPDSWVKTLFAGLVVLTAVAQFLPCRCPQCNRYGLERFRFRQHCIFCGYNPNMKEEVIPAQSVANWATKNRSESILFKFFFIISFIVELISVHFCPNTVVGFISLFCLCISSILCSRLIRCPYCEKNSLRMIPFKTTTEFCSHCGNKVEYKD